MQIFDDVIEGLKNIILGLLALTIYVFLAITIPLWIVPYLIYKKVK